MGFLRPRPLGQPRRTTHLLHPRILPRHPRRPQRRRLHQAMDPLHGHLPRLLQIRRLPQPGQSRRPPYQRQTLRHRPRRRRHLRPRPGRLPHRRPRPAHPHHRQQLPTRRRRRAPRPLQLHQSTPRHHLPPRRLMLPLRPQGRLRLVHGHLRLPSPLPPGCR